MAFTAFDIIKESESLRLKAYPDPATGGKPITIGYGCTRNGDGGEWKLGDVITKEQAEAFFYRDFNEEKSKIIKDPVMATLPDDCIGAVVSLCYNIKGGFGAFKKSQCYQAIKNKDVAGVFHNWDWGVSQKGVARGLAIRRAKELVLFLSAWKI